MTQRTDLLMLVDYPSGNTDELQACLATVLAEAGVDFESLQGAVRTSIQINFGLKPIDQDPAMQNEEPEQFSSNALSPVCVVYVRGVLRSQAQATREVLRENFMIIEEDFDPCVECETEIGSDSSDDWWRHGPQEDED